LFNIENLEKFTGKCNIVDVKEKLLKSKELLGRAIFDSEQLKNLAKGLTGRSSNPNYWFYSVKNLQLHFFSELEF